MCVVVGKYLQSIRQPLVHPMNLIIWRQIRPHVLNNNVLFLVVVLFTIKALLIKYESYNYMTHIMSHIVAGRLCSSVEMKVIQSSYIANCNKNEIVKRMLNDKFLIIRTNRTDKHSN